MLVNNGAAIERHSKTGRQLNKFNPKFQAPIFEAFTGKLNHDLNKTFEAFELSEILKNYYCDNFKGKTKKHYKNVKRIIFWLILNPHRFLKLNASKGFITYAMLKEITENLESLELLAIYQGYNVGTKPFVSIPAVIQSKIINKHWIE